MQSRIQRKSQTEPSKFVGNKYLSKPQLEKKASSLAAEKVDLQRKIKSMEKKVKHMLEAESVKVSPEQLSVIDKIIDENKDTLLKFLPEGSFSRLLWEQQVKAHTTPKRQMRWHPDLLRWAIAIHSKSPAAYRTIRDSGFMRLPHPNTLFSYTLCAAQNRHCS
ncbi:hypothetical protein HOLleu_01208 [Holothuria leucospilota]|uniref:Uncharacterized protein n=1 Tax=Holothuria leucospilota TaxID=206669 RepID=A0A9Q1HGA1_HOLLE|nr:hypothetical protein HOLleu_01208 [Holothuria leucospilota]